MAKSSEQSVGEVYRRDSPLGHRAQGLERDVMRTSPVFFFFVPFGTEPLLVNTESKTDRDRDLKENVQRNQRLNRRARDEQQGTNAESAHG